MNIKQLIEKGESETLEFKESLQTKDIIETISAFSNTKGGSIIIGVDNRRNIIGINVGMKTIEALANKIKQNTDPQIYPSISVEGMDGKNIIVVEVMESKSKPVFAFNRVYKRVGKSNHRVSSDEIRKMALEGKKVYWDEQICEEASLEDIDEKKVRWFLRRAKFERRLEIDITISVKEALKRLSLIKNNELTNAAILLFGKNPQRFFLQAENRCARFKGTKPLEFIDMKVFGGNIIDQREDSLEFIKEHIKLHAEIKGTERVETWEYPIEAIREAITNAICHRDYEMSSNVQVRIFDDGIEIWGCGPLPKPLTVEDLRKKHDSVLRNPLIGKCFFLIKYIEQWGTGTNRIVEWCLKHGLPEPIFEEIAGSFVVTLRKYHITEEILKELNERQRKIVEHLREHNRINRMECINLIGVSKDTTLRELLDLQKRGIIERLGKGKNTYYILV
jgi:ATP-dependent DNA helicase RecG